MAYNSSSRELSCRGASFQPRRQWQRKKGQHEQYSACLPVLRQRPQRRRQIGSNYTRYVVDDESLRLFPSDDSVSGVVGDCCCALSATTIPPASPPTACQPNLAYLVNELDCGSLDVPVRQQSPMNVGDGLLASQRVPHSVASQDQEAVLFRNLNRVNLGP